MNEESWYAAKCVFCHAETKRGPKQMYEERIILLRAHSFDDAIERAEKEAKEYCNDLDGCMYTGFVDVFHLFNQEIIEGTEVFSSMRRHDLKPREYIEQFYPGDSDDCEAVGEPHRWHNLDGKRSACYHCKVIRGGQLWKESRRRAS